MRQHIMWPLALALSLVLAGCFGAAGPDTAVDAARGDDTESAPDAGAPSATGRADAEDAADAGEAAPAGRAAPREEPVTFNGTVGTGVRACSMGDDGGTCVAVTPTGGGDRFFDTEFTGHVTRFTLTLTWEETSPVTREMGLIVHGCTPDGETCEWHHAWGASPLVLDVVDPEVLVTAPRIVVDGGLWAGVPPVYAGVQAEQPFTVTGTFTVVDDTPSTAADA